MGISKQHRRFVVMMYGRNGGISVADVDAVTNCHKFPHDWTLKPWIRPNDRPDVFIKPDWDTTVTGAALIDLAKTTFADNGAGVDLDTPQKAYAAIAEYLAGTTHPDAKPTTPST